NVSITCTKNDESKNEEDIISILTNKQTFDIVMPAPVIPIPAELSCYVYIRGTLDDHNNNERYKLNLLLNGETIFDDYADTIFDRGINAETLGIFRNIREYTLKDRVLINTRIPNKISGVVSEMSRLNWIGFCEISLKCTIDGVERTFTADLPTHDHTTYCAGTNAFIVNGSHKDFNNISIPIQ
ncbi:MAG: hypothetical protein ABL867_10585, partial [Rickettsiales bacterium]